MNRHISFNLDNLRNLLMRYNSGISISLRDLADVYIKTVSVQISHKNHYRKIILEFNVRGRDMISVVEETNSCGVLFLFLRVTPFSYTCSRPKEI